MDEVAKEIAADKKVKQIEDLRTRLEAAEKELKCLGFTLASYGTLEFFGASDAARASYHAKCQEARNKVTVKYDNAKLSLWTVGTLDEAQKIVEGVIFGSPSTFYAKINGRLQSVSRATIRDSRENSMKPRHAAALALALLLSGCSDSPRRCYGSPDNSFCLPWSTYLSCKVRHPGDTLAQSKCMWGGVVVGGRGAIIGSSQNAPPSDQMTPVNR